ncbi:MAG: ABC transporter substrate-binding protein [Sulfolobales archaeon]
MTRFFKALTLPTSVWAVLIVVFLVIGFLVGYFIPRPTAPGAPAVSGLPKEIPIGVIVALSGAYGSYGVREEAAAKLAEKDINDFVSRLGLDVRFVFYYEDYATKPDVALQKAQALAARGVKVIVGGLISGATKAIASYAEANKIVVITGSSTAARKDVAPPAGFVFRVLPSVEAEGVATANLILSLGIRNVMIISPEESYSLSFRDAFVNASRSMGLNVVADLTFPTDTKDFNPLIDSMERAAAPYLDRKEMIAVVANTWEDHATVLLTQANARNSPLLKLLWFASDTLPLSTVVIEQVGPIAERVKLIGGLFTGAASKTADHVRSYMLSTLGQEPTVYAYATYDAAWIAALAVLLAGRYDGDAIRTAVPLAAKIYWGATGNIEFNDVGDRSYADMIFYGVVGGKWTPVALYRVLENKFYWLTTIEVPKL